MTKGKTSFVLDTHIWVWWLTHHDSLKRKQRTYIDEAKGPLYISIISVWEVAKLVEKNKIRFSIPVDEWLKKAMQIPRLDILHLELPIILESTRLKINADPADQIIMATARYHNLPLMTYDERIINSQKVEII